MMLEVNNLTVELGGRPILRNLSIQAGTGAVCVLMGANGEGKSTLLRTLAGEYPHYTGEIKMAGRNLRQMSISDQAQQRAVLSQQLSLSLPFTVQEVVAMGRYVHGGRSATADKELVNYALRQLQVYDLRDRSYLTLSGGQKQRVQMARVLAQLLEVPDIQGMDYAGKKILLLDEPVTGMDILHQQLSLQLAQQLAKQGVLVVAVLHDFQLAAAYAQHVWMLKHGGVHSSGTVRNVFTPANISACFGIAVQVLEHPGFNYPLVVTTTGEGPIQLPTAATALNALNMSTVTATSLKDKWLQFRVDNPKVRIRDAAQQIGTSEGALVAAFAGTCVTRLNPDFRALIKCMPELGKVMVLTRNESCVIERKGVFEKVDVDNPHVGLVLGADIDLRMFMNKWAHGFAVNDDEASGFKTSIQVFDGQGVAVIKFYPTDATDRAAWDKVVADFTADVQDNMIAEQAPARKPVYAEQVDKTAFLEEWAVLKDTHDFFPLIMKHKVSRTQALALAEGRFARKTSNEAAKQLLEQAAASGLEIMIFVGNHGNIEIHTGPVNKILEIPGWINVMDPDLNIHLKMGDIAQSWIVEKPSVDGVVTSLEVFDAAGEMIVQFFGKRKPGQPELETWRALAATL
ncbi:heme ABC transporter ATP-binding protein [Chitinophaga horti]|uniref:Heme ABC transporter ATP-binding protein n=1 Tax=Chitinophaga horti TaxID=2920382 RepID=A0ABY6J381_9BACT|nr:heme ABC transporter ATP-binding protein [Chitinophaga horti]UYQ93097.1 heme ABC transporter ATP-binding protein [Chitinophaga horti]